MNSDPARLPMLSDAVVRQMVEDIIAVDGVVGVTLGGSRARGDALPSSDVDLGIYYDASLDLTALRAVGKRWSGPDAEIVGPGGWGPWVDGGGWLRVDEVPVDWLLRNVCRVREQWTRAQNGDFAFHMQVGHPLGFLDVAYAGELALAVVLVDPSGVLTELHREMQRYPRALRDAMCHLLWEADFLVAIAAKATTREDTGYVCLCLTRALMLCAHVLHAHNRRWVTNEKGLIPAVARLELAPPGFAGRSAQILGSLGSSDEELRSAIAATRTIIGEVQTLVVRHAR